MSDTRPVQPSQPERINLRLVLSLEQLSQMQMKWPKFAAVVSRADCEDPRAASRTDADPHGLFDRRYVQPIDHNFVDGVATVRQFGAAAAESRAIQVVGAGSEFFVPAADFAATANHAAGKRRDNAGKR